MLVSPAAHGPVEGASGFVEPHASSAAVCACGDDVCVRVAPVWLRARLRASSWLVSYKTLALGHARPFFAFARLEGGLRLIVAQLALETLLTALLRQDSARSGPNPKFHPRSGH